MEGLKIFPVHYTMQEDCSIGEDLEQVELTKFAIACMRLYCNTVIIFLKTESPSFSRNTLIKVS